MNFEWRVNMWGDMFLENERGALLVWIENTLASQNGCVSPVLTGADRLIRICYPPSVLEEVLDDMEDLVQWYIPGSTFERQQ